MSSKHQTRLFRRFQPFVEGAPFFHQINIVPGMLLLGIAVILQGTLTLSAGSASGTLAGENPTGLIQRIEVNADPLPGGRYAGGVVKSLVPRSIIQRRKYDRGTVQPDLSLGANGVLGTAVASTINSPLELNFALPGMAKPIETALRLDQFSNITLTITAGQLTDMMTGNDRTKDYSALTIDVVEFREYNPAYYPAATLYETDFYKSITGANARLTIDTEFPKTEAYLDALFIAETTGKTLSDSVINRVTLNSGEEQFYDMYKNHLKAMQRQYVTDQASSDTGLYFVPITQGGLLSGAMLDVNAILDVSNPGTDRLIVSTRRVAPARAA
jgi:hypothetical protein